MNIILDKPMSHKMANWGPLLRPVHMLQGVPSHAISSFNFHTLFNHRTQSNIAEEAHPVFIIKAL